MMKKSVLSLMVGAALMIAPLTASALTPMTADGMKDATGQAGVSIAIDGVKLETWVGKTRYTDDDGIKTGETLTGGASVFISEKHSVKYFNAITNGNLSDKAKSTLVTAGFYTDNASVAALTNDTTGNLPTGSATFAAHALSIDVGTCTALSDGLTNNYGAALVAGVVIGLPTLEIVTEADSYYVGIESNADATGDPVADNSGGVFIKIEKGNSVMAILGGTLEIAPH
ncbi:hypothetical protein DSLASN_11940 [Desulfoluna limicola]|uniref:DUF6160 domain-containing protein n=1 Tax=Desulfoluna limicola TaxID=2810562 RepID=A0ABN6EZ22_9BACT|nr:DUF6160 family protein [Desulfoluna limicola]BCS95562.1 hypothetical protein DSLASN_11940 [Desulfoluna limicola]